MRLINLDKIPCQSVPSTVFSASQVLTSNINPHRFLRASQVVLVVKNPPANAGDIRDWVPSLGWEDPLEEGMATHSSILAWSIAWIEEPDGLQSTGSQRVGHD